ncbi:hypothetical protein TWF718_005035 [Orbilia javanica]|uniref:Uncharacterized protein n=1 Tax=Orbilia javanica TaxID=47235 RepID=A0AAN8P0C5_9PEZI
MENNSAPSTVPSPGSTTISIQVGLDLLAQLSGDALSISLRRVTDNDINDDIRLRLGDLVINHLLAGQAALLAQGSSAGSNDGLHQASTSGATGPSLSETAVPHAIDPGLGPYELPADPCGAENIISSSGNVYGRPTPSIEYSERVFTKNKIFVQKNTAVVQLSTITVMRSTNTSFADSSSRLQELGRQPIRDGSPLEFETTPDGAPGEPVEEQEPRPTRGAAYSEATEGNFDGTAMATHETHATEPIPGNLAQFPELPDYFTPQALSATDSGDVHDFQDILDSVFNLSYTVPSPGLSSSSISDAQNPDNDRDALESLIEFLSSNLSYIPVSWRKFVETASRFLSKLNSLSSEMPSYKISFAITIVAFCLTRKWLTRNQIAMIASLLQTGHGVMSYLEELGVTGAQNMQVVGQSS